MSGLNRGRIAALAVAITFLSGCEKTLTRPPDPPLTDVEVTAVYLAIGLVWAMWVALAIAAVGARASTHRMIIGGVLLIPVVGVAGVFGRIAAESWRRDQILDGGPCRSIPWDERPTSMIEITCGGFLEGLGVFLAAMLLVPLALLFFVLAWLVLRGVPAGAIGRSLAVAAIIVLVLILLSWVFASSDSDAAVAFVADGGRPPVDQMPSSTALSMTRSRSPPMVVDSPWPVWTTV